MSYKLMRQAITLFRHADLSRSQQRHLQRKWLRMMTMLGDKHCCAKPVPRKEPEDRDSQRSSYMRLLNSDGTTHSKY